MDLVRAWHSVKVQETEAQWGKAKQNRSIDNRRCDFQRLARRGGREVLNEQKHTMQWIPEWEREGKFEVEKEETEKKAKIRMIS